MPRGVEAAPARPVGAGARTRRRLAGSLVVLALAGCTGGGVKPEPPADLDGYLAQVLPPSEPAEVRARQVATEEAIARCMAEKGFEYHPEIPAGSSAHPDVPFPLTVEYAKQYGYGITTEARGEGVPPAIFDRDTQTESEGARQNRAYVGSLSADAQQEYGAALYSEDDFDLEHGMAGDRSGLGCYLRGFAEAVPQDFPPGTLFEVSNTIQKRYNQIEEHPRLTALHGDWADCVADAGYAGPKVPLDASNLVYELVNAFGPTDQPYDEVLASRGPAVRQLQSAEIAIAVADATCQGEVGYGPALRALMAEIDQEMLTTYRAELDAWLEWWQENDFGR